MNKNYKKHLEDTFSYALLHLQLRKSNTYSYYYDSLFKDLVKMRVKDGIILTVPTYKFTRSIEECLSDNIYSVIEKKFRYGRFVSYVEIKDILIAEGSIQEKKSFNVKLKDMNLIFSYYKYPNGSYLHEKDRIDNVFFNNILDDELLERKPYKSHTSTFNIAIECAYTTWMVDNFNEYDCQGLLIHLVNDLIKLANVRYEKEIEERKNQKMVPYVLSTHDSDELCRY